MIRKIKDILRVLLCKKYILILGDKQNIKIVVTKSLYDSKEIIEHALVAFNAAIDMECEEALKQAQEIIQNSNGNSKG